MERFHWTERELHEEVTWRKIQEISLLDQIRERAREVKERRDAARRNRGTQR